MRFIKKIVERGNVTIPSDVREALEIDEGDIVEFEIVSVVRRTDRDADDATPPTDAATRSSPRPTPTATDLPRGNVQ